MREYLENGEGGWVGDNDFGVFGPGGLGLRIKGEEERCGGLAG